MGYLEVSTHQHSHFTRLALHFRLYNRKALQFKLHNGEQWLTLQLHFTLYNGAQRLANPDADGSHSLYFNPHCTGWLLSYFRPTFVRGMMTIYLQDMIIVKLVSPVEELHLLAFSVLVTLMMMMILPWWSGSILKLPSAHHAFELSPAIKVIPNVSSSVPLCNQSEPLCISRYEFWSSDVMMVAVDVDCADRHIMHGAGDVYDIDFQLW